MTTSPLSGSAYYQQRSYGAESPPPRFQLLHPTTWGLLFARHVERPDDSSERPVALMAERTQRAAGVDSFSSGAGAASWGAAHNAGENPVAAHLQFSELLGNARRLVKDNKIATGLGAGGLGLGLVATRGDWMPPAAAVGRAIGHGTVWAATSLGHGTRSIGNALAYGAAVCSRAGLSALVGGAGLFARGCTRAGREATATKGRCAVTGAVVGSAATAVTLSAIYLRHLRPPIPRAGIDPQQWQLPPHVNPFPIHDAPRPFPLS